MATAIIEMPDAVLLISMGYTPDPRRARSRNAKCVLRNVKESIALAPRFSEVVRVERNLVSAVSNGFSETVETVFLVSQRFGHLAEARC